MQDSLGPAALVAVGLVNAVAMLVIAPLGLRLAHDGSVDLAGPAARLARWWPVASVPAAVSLLLEPGVVAGALAVPYLLATLLACAFSLDGTRSGLPALLCLPVAASALLAHRSGVRLFGFGPDVLALTVAHFHVAGFGALLLLALLARAEATPRTRLAAAAAPAGVALVGAGFLLGRMLGRRAGDGVELLGAAVLATALWLAVAELVTRRRGAAQLTLAGVAGLTMTLALLYAGGSFLGLPHPTLDWMVAGHGVLNAGAVLGAVTLFWTGREQPMRPGRFRHRVGTGRERFTAASEALLRWDMHRGAGAGVDAGTPRAVVGLRMVSRLGPRLFRLAEPCEVIEVVERDELTVMHYLALPGHLFEGDERFAVSLDDEGTVWFDVAVQSRPALLVARLAGPVVPVAQRAFVALCARALRRA